MEFDKFYCYFYIYLKFEINNETSTDYYYYLSDKNWWTFRSKKIVGTKNQRKCNNTYKCYCLVNKMNNGDFIMKLLYCTCEHGCFINFNGLWFSLIERWQWKNINYAKKSRAMKIFSLQEFWLKTQIIIMYFICKETRASWWCESVNLSNSFSTHKKKKKKENSFCSSHNKVNRSVVKSIKDAYMKNEVFVFALTLSRSQINGRQE